MRPKKTWHKHFLGVRQQHNYWLYKVIDDVLMQAPQIERFVEIGTGGGALSVVLGLHAVQRGTHLLTFDPQIRGHKPKLDRVFKQLEIEFVEDDAFAHCERVQQLIEDKPTFLFCDGGDKVGEAEVFSPLLPVGSIIGIHDYASWEAPEEEIRERLSPNFTPVLEEYWLEDYYDIQTCFWRKERDILA
ncbi:MAG: class I SAM-dependent methyltransferase [Candidatus Bathyarchaeota archaeon]|nr:class I SAM-dependent methyltransferase [Candidatus Bathyarchaeota archaeon]